MEDDKNNPLVKLLINVSFVEGFKSSNEKFALGFPITIVGGRRISSEVVSRGHCIRPIARKEGNLL
jgi:hypothetical protein